MKPNSIRESAKLLAHLKDLKEIDKALKDYNVVGITLNRGERAGGVDDIELSYITSGTGTITNMGYPDLLREHLTQALQGWIIREIGKVETRLKELGVEL